MRLPQPIVAILVLGVQVMACPLAAGQEPGDDDPMLSGPTVPDRMTRTLVQTDMRGQFMRIEGRPEEAALGVIEIDPQRRELARQAIAPHREALNRLLADHIDLVRQVTDAIQAGESAKAAELAREMFDRFDPEHARDPLLKLLAAALSPDEAAELARVVDEYWTAWIDWSLRNAADKSAPARQRVEDRLTFELFQQELRQAYERTLRPYRQKLEIIAEVAQPTPEQRAAIRELVLEHVRNTKFSPTPEQRNELARRIYESLDEEQRIKLIEYAISRY